jgi:hypothetical protein
VHSDGSIPGVAGLLGAGVYTSMPPELPAALRDGQAVVAGEPRETVDAVVRLAGWCRTVTWIKTGHARVAALHGLTNVTILHGAEIVCVDGLGQLECVVARRLRTGAVSAYGAAALFLLG